MNDSFTHDQTTVLITSLIDMLAIKNEEIELGEAYTASLYKVIDGLDAEITSLKAKAKAKTPKVTKVTKVAKAPKVAKVEAPAPKNKGGRPKKVVTEAPAKRKPGRPKKVVK
jgi:hypothetical protein